MTTPQHAIGSGFGAGSTADDVLEGIDLDGAFAIVTGGVPVEAQFATNHLGHFALANRLWPLLAPGGARVVSVSSGGHQRSGIRWDDMMFEHGYDKWQAYETWCATSPQLDGMGGVYCEDCDIAEPAVENAAVRAGVRDYAADPEQAARLWTLSAQLTGVDAFATGA